MIRTSLIKKVAFSMLEGKERLGEYEKPVVGHNEGRFDKVASEIVLNRAPQYVDKDFS